MVVFFLPLRTSCSKESTSCKSKILSLSIVFSIDQEILLLCSHCCYDSLDICLSKEMENLDWLFAYSFHTSQKRSLFIQYFSWIWTESCRDTESIFLNECITCRIPSCVTTSLEGSSQSTWRERWSVRLTLNKFLSAEIKNNLSSLKRSNKCIMLLSCHSCKRLEPMSKVSSPLLNSPILHSVCNAVCNIKVKVLSFPYCLFKGFVNILR